MSAVIVASKETNRSGAGVARATRREPWLGLLLRAFCYCCSITSRGITIAIGPWPHALASTLIIAADDPAALGAGLYAGAEPPYPDDIDEGCPAPLYAGVPPSQDPSQPPLAATG
jgi:hypothetical protein